MKLNLFLYWVLIFVFKRRFEVKITLIHDIWRYICVEIFSFNEDDEDSKEEDEDDEHLHHISGYFFSFLIQIYFKK